jgi:hypothetical protein
MKQFSHYILTRFNTQLVNDKMLYDEPDKAESWMRERMELFKKTKESVLAQEGDFRWIISLDKRTPREYVEAIGGDSRIKIINEVVQDALKDIKIWTPWVITTRLDNDDQLQPGFVKAVQEHFRPEVMVIDVRFEELDWKRQMVFSGERRWAGSMFLSLVEKSDWIVTAFCRPHGMVAGGYPTEGNWKDGWGYKKIIPYIIIEQDLAYMVCHSNNMANRIRGEFKRKL